jgi:Patatin-like phospholipase
VAREPRTYSEFLEAVVNLGARLVSPPTKELLLHDPDVLEQSLKAVGRWDGTYYLYLARHSQNVYTEQRNATANGTTTDKMTVQKALLCDLHLFTAEDGERLVSHKDDLNLLDGFSPGAKERRARLAELLWESPKTQSRLARLLDATPSRWLLEQEIPIIEGRRELMRRYTSETRPSAFEPTDDTRAYAFQRGYAGLAFSGGGIRSATFNLGVLQALAESGLLHGFDYVSSVSGGGYIHQWYAAWLQRSATLAAKRAEVSGTPVEDGVRAANSFVENALIAQPKRGQTSVSPPEIAFLRSFSNYLTPRKGLFSLDTWTMIVTWMRNAFLNQVLIVAWIMVAITSVRLIILWADALQPSAAWAAVLWAVWVILFSLAWAGINLQFASLEEELRPRVPKGLKSCKALTAYFAMLIGSAALWVLLTIHTYKEQWFVLRTLYHGVYWDAAVFAGALIALQITSGTTRLFIQQNGHGSLWKTRAVLLFVAASVLGAISSAALHREKQYLREHRGVFTRKADLARADENITKSAAAKHGDEISIPGNVAGSVYGNQQVILCSANAAAEKPSLLKQAKSETESYLGTRLKEHGYISFLLITEPLGVISIFFLALVLHHGLEGRYFRTLQREWLARMRAQVTLILVAWTGITSVAVFGPLIAHLVADLSPTWAPTLWAAISGAGLFAGKSGKTAGTPGSEKTIRGLSLNVLAVIGGYVFIAGYLISISTLVEHLSSIEAIKFGSAHESIPFLLILGVALTIGLLYGFQLDINQFSMHAFYRNRLARCYLGASTEGRRPEAFTGIDPGDSVLRVSDLMPGVKYPGPFPIFCATVNLSVGADLAWQERKGASFAFTPLTCGYDIPWQGEDKKAKGNVSRMMGYSGYRSTADFGTQGGPFLATAAAISGAAASPNMGFHTNLAAAFLLTCANVRLGWWMRNTRLRNISLDPSQEQKLFSPAPRFPARFLLEELLGKSSAKSEFLNLTDGGHFDNMGLYELVRRRCKYIVLCDAAADPNSTFDTIAGAILRCRSDFGAEIMLNLDGMLDPDAKDDAPKFRKSYAVGEVRYPEQSQPGVVLYLKASIAGKDADNAVTKMEMSDVQSYVKMHKDFPNDSTADQWFDESKFESYRLLGRYIALRAMESEAAEFMNAVLRGE